MYVSGLLSSPHLTHLYEPGNPRASLKGRSNPKSLDSQGSYPIPGFRHRYDPVGLFPPRSSRLRLASLPFPGALSTRPATPNFGPLGHALAGSGQPWTSTILG